MLPGAKRHDSLTLVRNPAEHATKGTDVEGRWGEA